MEEFQVDPVINGLGIYTDLGGSRLSERVLDAMVEANSTFLNLSDLLTTTGTVLAGLVGSPSARAVPGASAGIVLAVAASITKGVPENMEGLPLNTDGLPREVLIQSRHHYKYDHMVGHAGGTLRQIGNINGTSAEEIRGALSRDTAAILHPAHLDGAPGTVPLEVVAAIASEVSVPLLVDAAYMCSPPGLMSTFVERGADVAIFSAKYFGGPNAGGFVVGTEAMIASLEVVDFTRFESSKYLSFGRPFKLDRQTIVAVVVALQEWFSVPHERRLEEQAGRAIALLSNLDGVPSVRSFLGSFTMEETLDLEGSPNCVVIETSDEVAERVEAVLRSGSPAILVHRREGSLIVDVECMNDDDIEAVSQRLVSSLRSESVS